MTWKQMALAALLVPQVALGAIVWTVTKSTDCTGAGTPSGCCVVASPGSNPSCYARQSGGTQFVVRADVHSDGGTYTAGGDPVSPGSLGLTTINYANCTVSNGYDVVPLPQVNGKILMKLWSAGGTEATGAIASTVWLQCDFYGR